VTPEQRQNTLEAIGELRLADLPDEALIFLVNYLTTPGAHERIGHLAGEIVRLHGLMYTDREYAEAVGYTGSSGEPPPEKSDDWTYAANLPCWQCHRRNVWWCAVGDNANELQTCRTCFATRAVDGHDA